MVSVLILCLWAVAGVAVEPPPMPHRAIAPDKEPVNGAKFILNDGDLKFTLFVPELWKPPAKTLTMHFHTADWFVIQEHVRRGAKHPLATFNLGEGSSVYRRPFEDAKRFGRVLQVVEKQLGTPVEDVEMSSFNAGYGAVREIVKQPQYFARIRAIILADSMHAALETNSLRKPLREHIEVWAPYARAAMEGKKTFVVTYSEVPTATYASSSECAEALLNLMGVKQRAGLETGVTDFPLLLRADVGNLHVWGYGGTNARAHMTHARHIADLWKAIGK